MINPELAPVYTRQDIAGLIGKSLATVDRYRKEHWFPQPHRFGRSHPAWNELQVLRIIGRIDG